MIKFIGATFPTQWLWSKYEQQCIDSVKKQINNYYVNQKNLLINLTWFGPQFDNKHWQQFLELYPEKFDNLFLLSTVDPPMINPDQIDEMITRLGNPRLFKIGNFDTEYHFNFFAPILEKHFAHYNDAELLLEDPKYLYINYNRKPREHRVRFVKQLYEKKLNHFGVITLGKANIVFDKDPDNTLYISIGENPADYIKHGHWYNTNREDDFGIPHDVLSLHNMYYWKHHFLHIIGATEFNVWDDIFVSETQFKPIIGLRPFLINGNIRTYQWLIDNGFQTFNHWFPKIDFENPDTVHESLCRAIEYLSTMSKPQILDMYNSMLPDLIHNKNRFYEYAREQSVKINNLFN